MNTNEPQTDPTFLVLERLAMAEGLLKTLRSGSAKAHLTMERTQFLRNLLSVVEDHHGAFGKGEGIPEFLAVEAEIAEMIARLADDVPYDDKLHHFPLGLAVRLAGQEEAEVLFGTPPKPAPRRPLRATRRNDERHGWRCRDAGTGEPLGECLHCSIAEALNNWTIATEHLGDLSDEDHFFTLSGAIAQVVYELFSNFRERALKDNNLSMTQAATMLVRNATTIKRALNAAIHNTPIDEG